MNETQFLNLLRRHLPGYFVKIHGGLMQAAGLPDLIGCWRGKFVGVELKVHPNKLTPIQEATLQRIAESNGIALVFTKKGDNLCATFYYRGIDLVVSHKSLNPLPISMLSKESLRQIFLSCVSTMAEHGPLQKKRGVD